MTLSAKYLAAVEETFAEAVEPELRHVDRHVMATVGLFLFEDDGVLTVCPGRAQAEYVVRGTADHFTLEVLP
jgi:hypothetical protein